MTFSPVPYPDGSAAFLERWRAASIAGAWAYPSDWSGPAVTGMAIAVQCGAGIEAAAAELGTFRADRGVGLTEGLDDLAVLFQHATNADAPYAATRSFAASWVEATSAALADRGAIDALTGLVTRAYLVPRLRELYAEAAARGIHPDQERCLVVIDRRPHLARWQRVIYAGQVGRVVTTVLDGGQTNSVLESGTFVSIAPRDDALAKNIERIATALRPRPPRHGHPLVRIESLPRTLREAEELLDGL